MKNSHTAIRPPMSVRSPMPGRGSRIPWLPALTAVAGLVACEGESAPEPPEACGVIPQQAVPVGEPALIQPCFQDPEGGTLTLTASSSDVGVATVSVEGLALRIVAVSPGLATIAVVAADPDELTAGIEFEVSVPNRPPRVCRQLPQQELFVRQTALIQPCFEDPDGQEFTLGASSSDVEVATVEVLHLAVRIKAVSPGTATVTVEATDPGGESGRMDVQVLVPNRPPITQGSPGPAEVVKGESRRWRLGDYMRDPDYQHLTYGTSSANPEIAAASVVEGGTLMVTGVAEGTTMVTITGTDPGGLSATLRFQVTITR